MAAGSNQFSYTAPSNLVLFVFINSITGATALVTLNALRLLGFGVRRD